MLIVIPMAGLSRRFAEAGYTVPKYMLKVGGTSMFRHAVQSFETVFDQVTFLFVHRDVNETAAFIDQECADMQLGDYIRIAVDAPTRGQAETVAIGLRQAGFDANTEPLLIFNIDTIRPGYCLPAIAKETDGYLEVFRGEGEGWSFVRPMDCPGQKVAETTEKQRISNLCSTGIYYFRRVDDFLDAFEKELSTGPSYSQEYYVAPLYNHLINQGLDIRYDIIEANEVIFSGVPSEFEAFRAALKNAPSDP